MYTFIVLAATHLHVYNLDLWCRDLENLWRGRATD